MIDMKTEIVIRTEVEQVQANVKTRMDCQCGRMKLYRYKLR